MSIFETIPADIRVKSMKEITNRFGPKATVVDNDNIQIMYDGDFQPTHGYVVVKLAATKYDRNSIEIVDSTPDMGADLIATLVW